MTLAVVICAALQGLAYAAPGTPGETARTLVAELDRDGPAHELVEPALNHAKDALAKAQTAAPTRAPMLEATALEWAEVARDLARASAAERTSDRLEQDVQSTQTEVARLRAAVEQMVARVGRARQDLKQLENGAAQSPASSGMAKPGGAGGAAAGNVTSGKAPPGSATPSNATPGNATPGNAPPGHATPGKTPPASGARATPGTER
jgi:hypothetical protein